MEIRVLYFDGCPHWQVVVERLHEALRIADRQDADVLLEPVDTPEAAERWQFRGSPTVLMEGTDPFGGAGPVGLSCRIYDTDDGPAGAPTVDQLVRLLRTAPGGDRR